MAPIPEAYFPSLDKCFSGGVQLVSWRRAFLYTCNPQNDNDDAANLRPFLSHPQSTALLANCLSPFPSPSAKSKSDFESKTSAVHAETTTQSSYDLKEIKADALWLSQRAGIDEITALRITVLEWQTRPATRLLGKFSDEETTSLQSAAGADNLRVSLAGPSFSETLRQRGESTTTAFSSEKSRRLRLRSIFLEEKSHVLKTSRKLFALSLRDGVPGQPSVPQSHGSDDSISLSDLGAEIFKDKSAGDGHRQFLQECISATRNRLSEMQEIDGWLGPAESSEEVADAWKTALVEDITHILQILFLQFQASAEIPDSSLLLSWLRLMTDYNFLQPLQVPCKNPVAVLLPLQALVSLTTLAFLKLPLSIPSIIEKMNTQADGSSKPPYFLSKADISQVNELFLNACGDFQAANPAAFAWGSMLHTMREIALSDKHAREIEQFHSAVDSFQYNTPDANQGRGSEQSLYEELLECARTPRHTVEESIGLLTSNAMSESVGAIIIDVATQTGSMSAVDDVLTDCWARMALLDLIRTVTMFMQYSAEIIRCVIAILVGSPKESAWLSDVNSALSNDPRFVFLNDDDLMHDIFHIARCRFPYETLPFLKLCRALVIKDLVNEDGLPAILSELENMNGFTQVVPADFQGYHTIREDENANLVSLAQSLPMFDHASTRKQSSFRPSDALVVSGSSQIPPETTGIVVSESKPAVIQWKHQYSCLSFLGAWLEECNEDGGYSLEWHEDAIAEIIGLLADLILTSDHVQMHNDTGSSAKTILEMASDGLSGRSDIVSVIFEIFEGNLHKIGPKAGLELDSTVECTRFIRALLTILPGRVWPLLSRSSLLGSDGKGGIMTAIISAVEVTSGNYPFLLSCIDLFEAIVNDVASHAVLRRSPNAVTVKSATSSDWTAGVPSHIMRGILLNFTRAMVEVYNSNANWRFSVPEQRFKINTALAQAFEKILYYACATNDGVKLEAKVTGVFSTSASYLFDILRPQSQADLPFNPIFRLIIDGLQTPSTLYVRDLKLMEKQVNSTLGLSNKLLQVARLLGSPVSLLEGQLFKAAPVLVKLYAMHDDYRLPVVTLFDSLISGAALDSTHEPPSIVGHLGQESACLFLDVLSQFDKPLGSRPLFLSIWHLLSMFVSKRQQWLAVYILTGSSPRQSLQKEDAGKAPRMRGAAFLQIALDRLSNIENLELQEALPMLEFVSYAQENWPWATPELRKHPQFLNSIVNHVSKLKITALPVVGQIFATRLAAVTADLCTVYLHSAKEMQDRTFVKTLIPLVSWYAKDAVEIPGYNASLHANLKKNFEMRYTGCKLDDFKRSPLEHRILGREYYYDIYLGEKLLSYDFAWAGKRNQGFADEFERANVNLSLVEAQVSLLHSWKFFAMEHCADFMVDREVQKSMALVVRNSLQANAQNVPQEAIFERIQQTRVEFAQALLQHLVEIGCRGAETFSLLGVVWEALRTRHLTYEDALINDDMEYYRPLLNVLFLALQFHVDGPSRAAPETLSRKAEVSSDLSLVGEIVHTVVAEGFKTLTTYLHDQPQKCTPKDFATITAILQTCLHVKNADRMYEHIVFHIADNDTARHATTLFSWADQLLVDGDPVYGELSVSFLVKLSTIPMLAEHLAVEAVLMRLSTCRLTSILQQPKGNGPFDPIPKLYSIWTGGILPLCLNLLYHVIRTAPEVSAFINQFEGQLNRASDSFAAGHTMVGSVSTPRRISLSMASEVSSLALISFILDRFREAGASAGVDAQSIQLLKWDRVQVKEDIEELLERKQNLRARIAPTTERELVLARQKPASATSGAENRLEEKIVNELSSASICLGGEEEA